MPEPPKDSRSPETAPRRSRASLAVVYVTVFLDLLGFGIILPSLPYFARELGASGLLLGILFTAYSGAQLVGAALLGRLSDRMGRRPVLLLSLAGAALAFVFCGLAESLVVLCLARGLAGLFGGSVATAQAYIADVTTRAERAKFMGLLGASIGMGFVLGPALGAGIVSLGWGFAGSAFAAAGLAALNFFFGLWRLEEPLPPAERSRARAAAAEKWHQVVGRPDRLRILAANFFAMFGFVGMETTFAYLAQDRFGIAEKGFGLILVMVGVVMIAVQGGLLGMLTKRFGVRPVAVAGALLMAAALSGLAAATTMALLLAASVALAASQGLTNPTLATLLSHTTGPDDQGAVLGAGQSMGAFARALGPLVAGALYDLHLTAPYLTGGALAALAAVLIFSLSVEEESA